MSKKLLLGDEAVALGALHAGLSGVYAYPGTPSTEITEFIQLHPLAKERNVHSRWCTNEKTAMEAALGMSFMGKRALVCMKHVGMNVCADPFVNSGMTGVNGGVVVLVADDPSMHSSQDEQDSRFYGKFAMIPTFEPSNQQEAYDMMEAAFDYSEQQCLPVLMRVTTRMAHSRAVVQVKDEARPENGMNYNAVAANWVLLPANARKRNDKVTAQQAQLEEDAANSPYNSLTLGGKASLGIIASGIAYNYVQEALNASPRGGQEGVALLKVSQYPLPKRLVRQLLDSCEKVMVVEEGQPFIEEQVRGVFESRNILGRLTGELPRTGELTPDCVAAALSEELRVKNEEFATAIDESADGSAEANSKLYTLRSKLPIGLKESLVGVPVAMHMPVLCSLMPLAAAYADQVEVRYCDGEMQKLGMMSIIYGEQASGKSVCKHAVNIWKRQLDDEDALARKREDEWKERKKSRKANEKAPEDPKVLIRVVPVTVSCSTLLKRLKNANGHTLFSFGEELDTLRKTNGAGSWSSKYDIYRLAFDPIDSEWGQDYNSDQAESGVVKVAYNWSMLGTSGAVRKCFKSDNVENGLSSRILLAEMPDTSFAKMPHYVRRTMDDEARIQEAVTRLRSYSGYVDTPRLRKAIDQWVEEQRVVALKDIDHVKDTYRRRAAVIGFRCGVIFHLLTGRVKESNACLEFATMMADYCLNQQIKVFGASLQNQYVDAQQECQRYGANNSIFDQLPPTFTADDLAALKPGNAPRNSIIKIISRWNRDGWVVKVDTKRWSKTKSDNDKMTS